MHHRVGIREILFPSRCIGCRSLHRGLCPRCASIWKFSKIESSIEGVPVFSSLRYTSVASHILLAAKEDGIKEGDDLLISAIRNGLGNFSRSTLSSLVLVPIPSTSRANRKRGRHFVFDLLTKIATSESVAVSDLLEHKRRVVDQTQLNSLQRVQNLAEAMRVRGPAKVGRGIILVDDLVTTGATLGEAVKTMKGSGAHVVGAITAFLAHPIR